MNNNNMWFVIGALIVALLASGVTFLATKAHYEAPAVVVNDDSIGVDVTSITPGIVDAPARIETTTVHDTVWPEPGRPVVNVSETVYAKLDTTLTADIEITVEDSPPILAFPEVTTSIAYDIAGGRYSVRQSLGSVHVELPVRTETVPLVVEKEDLLWVMPTLLMQGPDFGGGVTLGLGKYSLGRKWVNNQRGIWEVGVKFGI